MKIGWRKALLWLLVAGQLFFIYAMSAQDAPTSNQTSGRVAMVVARVFTPGFDGLSQEEQAALAEGYQHATRKAAHVAEYALLGCLLTLALCGAKKRGALAALLIAIGCAALDEFGQLAVAGRSGQFTDVLIDSGGAVLGMAAALTLKYLLIMRGSRR